MDTTEQPAKRNSAECGSVLNKFHIILTCVLFLPDGASQAASAMENNNNDQEKLERQKLLWANCTE